MRSGDIGMIDRASAMRALGVGTLYLAPALLTLGLTRYEGGTAFLWVSTAVLIAELSIMPVRRWAAPLIACAIAGMIASSLVGAGVLAAPMLAVFNIGEAVVGALMLRRFSTGSLKLRTVGGVLLFALACGIVAPALSGLGGAAIIAWSTGMPFWSNWFHWYAAHALGTITFAPMMAMVLSGEIVARLTSLPAHRRWEAAALTALTVALTALVFAQTSYPLLFLPLLPLMIAVFRFGRFGGAIGIVLLALVGGALTLQGYGPVDLVEGTSGTRILFFHFYTAVSVLMTLFAAAEVQQRVALVGALRESEARYRLITDGSSDVIVNLAIDGTIRYVSRSIAELGGHDPAALIGVHAGALIAPEDHERVFAVHRKALLDPQATFIVEYRGLTVGESIWCESHMRAIVDDAGSVLGVVSAIRDISRHKTEQADLARTARTDALTGLVNRRAFDEVLAQRIADAQAGRGTGCCAILDLDFFKAVNDRHGHASGDRVLRAFAKIAAKSLRDTDLIARLGGEEFGLILWGADMAGAHRICDRLRREIADLKVATDSGADIMFTVSGGIAPIDGTQPRSAVLRDADEALYRAKDAGRNRLAMAA